MGQAYVGEVRAFSFSYQPAGWLPCDGRLLPIMSNQPLFAVIGTTYGGNGETDFALPEIPGLSTAGSTNSLGYCIAVTGAVPQR